ncbi:hypothetical protein BD311DRAFT_99064 [Dichomitus squalens]|uniref:C2H2-type domain-containing protein n=1 Tax=Dichomitus squalens TaxID=114155 RepID=A0A4Q9MXW9_9APHY|nr:hypothetical protein BD311DRAFT_99064 [Dichomitus squalens]
MILMLAMDPTYSYYQSPSNDSPTQQNARPHAYPRQPDQQQPSGSPPFSYTHTPTSLSGSGVQVPPLYHHGNASGYPQPHPSGYHHQHQQSMTSANALPPLVHAHAYSSRDVSRHDVPSGFAVPSLGPTLHDLPFAAARSSSSSSSGNRQSGNWGTAAHQPSRTPPLYDRQASYPPSRHGSHHPSLSHSTHLIPTPAQAAQSYHNYPAHTSPSPPLSAVMPVVAAIPPATSSSPPQERYYCDKCDKSFGRAHDKKRHFESTHLQQSHACRFCTKTFSRNDSLKRHQDNGCDKDPEFNT